jgi:hypothetical protein
MHLEDPSLPKILAVQILTAANGIEEVVQEKICMDLFITFPELETFDTRPLQHIWNSEEQSVLFPDLDPPDEFLVKFLDLLFVCHLR